MVICSKEKLPLMRWPSTFKATPVPSTRTYVAPPGSTRLVVTPATMNVSSTSEPVLFSFTPSVPPSVTPGTFKATVPPTLPAMPVGRITKNPLPLVTCRSGFAPSPRLSRTSVTATRTMRSAPPPLPLVNCSKTKLPLKLWPATVSRTPVPDTRRNGPAGSARVSVLPPT